MVFGKLLSALKKTRDVLTAGLSRLFSGRKLDEAFLDGLYRSVVDGLGVGQRADPLLDGPDLGRVVDAGHDRTRVRRMELIARSRDVR